MHRRGVIVVALVAATCAATAAQAPRALTFSARADVVSLDPQEYRDTFTAEFLANVAEPLVRYSPTLQPEPALAERWESRSESRTRFHLRAGVRFSNGHAFTADDVVFTFTRGRAPTSPFRGALAGIERMTAAEPLVVDVDSSLPTDLVLRMLTTMLILDREWVEAQGASAPSDPAASQEGYLTRHIVGTGPYVVTAFEPGVRVTLDANPTWWGRRLTPDLPPRAVYTPIRADATRTAALLAGQIDVMLSTPLQDIARLRRTPGVRVLEMPSTRTVFLGLNQRLDLRPSPGLDRNPLADLRVRRAVAHAVDSVTLVDRVLAGHAVPAATIAAPGINDVDPTLVTRLPFDADRARALLREAGLGDGFDVALDCPNDSYLQDEVVCGAVRAMLARVGIRVRVQVRDKARHVQAIAGRQSAFHVFGWAASTTHDAHNVLADVLHTRTIDKGTWNIGGYSNPLVDALEARVARERDGARRRALVTDALRLHGQDAAHVPLYTQTVIWAVRDGVTVTQTPIEAFWLRLARVAPR